jgi:FlaA1/EpsC-like NDP-sugar epimerase
MQAIVALTSRLEPRIRRLVIMLMDVAMVLAAIPLSLELSQSRLSFDPFGPASLLLWLSICVGSHLLFRVSGLYRMMWRFASTPDFFNILKNCALLTGMLYGGALFARHYVPVTGLNERQFLVFFLMTFAFISTPRLIYRYMREGAGWSSREVSSSERPERRALFFGDLHEADVIISFSRAGLIDRIRVVGIATTDSAAPSGSRIQGVPIVGHGGTAAEVLKDYVKDTEGLDLLIFGHGAEKAFREFSELVRIARRAGVAVEQFSGLSQLRRSGRLVLEKVEMETILRRSTVSTDKGRLSDFVTGRRILVTGGAGSIGRTLVKRVLDLDAASVMVVDNSEFNVFQLQNALEEWKDRDRLTMRIADIGDRDQLSKLVQEFRPDIIYHAAALKHVPLLEANWESAIKTNVFGTVNAAEVAAEHRVPHFVLISSDKAADPTSVLGLTKRTAEQIVSAMHFDQARHGSARAMVPNFTGVRFGNVFGSDGSVATIFQKQIDAGGPVTITDPTMTRYLMTIAEAVDLVILASAASSDPDKAGSHGIYMLDMGHPVSILAVAETMIRLAGKKPYQDIPIVITGKRPGEKLHETLSSPGEAIVNIGVPSVFALRTGSFSMLEVKWSLDALRQAVARRDRRTAIALMHDLYRPLSAELEAPATTPAEAARDEAGLEAAARGPEPYVVLTGYGSTIPLRLQLPADGPPKETARDDITAMPSGARRPQIELVAARKDGEGQGDPARPVRSKKGAVH